MDNIWLQTGAECPAGCPAPSNSAARQSKALDRSVVALAEAAAVVAPTRHIPREERSDHCLVHCNVSLLAPALTPPPGDPREWRDPGMCASAAHDGAGSDALSALLLPPSYDLACEGKLALLHRCLRGAEAKAPASMASGAAAADHQGGTSSTGCLTFPLRRGKITMCQYVPVVEPTAHAA